MILYGGTLLCLLAVVMGKEFYFDYKEFMIPHPEKAHRGGEDAYFSQEKMLTVADGVGGWNNQGIDPSKYSRFLCQKAGQYVLQNQTLYLSSPLEIIKRAQEENDNLGSATMVVTTLHEEFLKICYIGDSGVMVIRPIDEQILSIYEFTEQQHGFNFPYQLAKQNGDHPAHSICLDIQVKEGDIVLVGSDGLFDNVSFAELLTGVRKAVAQGTLLTTLPQSLTELAIERGKNKRFNSPFAQRAKQQGVSYIGGKLDDTTLTIARIRSKSTFQTPQL